MPHFSRTLSVAFTALSLLVLPLVAQADDAEATKLADRSSPRYEKEIPGASIKAGGSMVLVNAPIAIVRKVVTDYGKYSSFMPRFKKSRIVSKKDGKTDVYLEVPILHGAATVWSQVRFEAPVKEGEKGERIEGKMVEGNVDDMRAVWHLRAVDDTHTVLKLELLIVPKLPVPGSLVTQELADASDRAVATTRDRAENKAAEGESTAQK